MKQVTSLALALALSLSYGAQQRMTTGVTFASTSVLDSSHSPFRSQPAAVVATLRGM